MPAGRYQTPYFYRVSSFISSLYPALEKGCEIYFAYGIISVLTTAITVMARSITEKQVIFYEDAQGKAPCSEWINGLRDAKTRRRILQRIYRIESGNYGDYKSLTDGEGVLELRLKFGSGYRIYFGEDGDKIVVLLCGGDKSTQTKDIKQAKIYWKEYLR